MFFVAEASRGAGFNANSAVQTAVEIYFEAGQPSLKNEVN